MRIVFVIPKLSAGGAERVVSVMARHWHDAGNEITILTYDDGKTPPFYDLPKGVRHRPLDLAGVPRNVLDAVEINLRRLATLRRAVKEASPDVVIAFLSETNVQTLLATRGLGIPVIVSERSNPAYGAVGRIWRLLQRRAYTQAAALAVQTKKVTEHFLWMPQEKIFILPNPVFEIKGKYSDELSIDFSGKSLILTVGRLIPSKGFDVLIRAFSRAAKVAPEWQLVLVGDGKERHALEALAEECGVGDRVVFTGTVKGVGAVYKKAEIFVLSSFFEGFPNVLCEAMAHGLPVVATDCDYGPSEIVRPGMDGLLVPVKDEHAMAEALRQLMSDEAARKRMGEKAQEILERFSVKSVMEKWDALVREVTQKRRS